MWRKASIVAVLLLLTSVLVAQPAFAQNPVWSGQYYNNPNLQGTPVFTRNDSNIAFNWGSGSPGSGIDNDNFSVRWATDVQLSAGTYRFYAQADDKISVTFNFGFQPVINTFGGGQVNQLVTGDVNVPSAGVYHIQVDFSEGLDQAFAFVSFANLATNPTGPSFPAPIVNPVVPTSNWTAQYYANTGLAGDPVAILTESTPSHDWGNGAPLPAVPADNFSVRWTSTQNLTGGSYMISARADDGVRVFVNGNAVINEFHAASGQTYSANVTLPAGLNYFQVEFFEGGGAAFLDFSITQTSGGAVQPTQPPAPSGATATVTAYRLNVRTQPNATAQVITRINRNETYPIIGRTADNLWYLLTQGGTQGWVSGRFINVANGGNIPIVGASQPVPNPPQSANNTVTPIQNVNVVIRNGPGTQYARIGLLPVGGVAQLIGRNINNSWWQINFNGLIGWVSAQFTSANATNINSVAVTG
ncbi:MAG: PA14 domain-containing protein [Chloroflexota bacterium]